MSKYHAGYVWRAYKYASTGVSDRKLAELLGIMRPTFRSWRRKHAAFAEALREGRAAAVSGPHGKNLERYIYDHLSKDMRELWDEICRFEQMRDGQDRISSLLGNQGKETRQRLLLHAATANHFSLSKALKLVQVSKAEFDQWQETDPDFSQLVDELEWHKKNFFEECAVSLVESGDTMATVAINRAKNADRGYSESKRLTVESTVNHNHNLIDITKLELSIDVRRELLAAIRNQQEATKLLEGEVIDVE